MCLALLLSLAGECIMIARAHYGAGRHVGDFSPAIYSQGMKMNVMSGPIYVDAVATVKGTCWPRHVVQGLGYTNATLNIATDVFFAVGIPVPLF